MEMSKNIDEIQQYLSTEELCAQLAEEAAELAKAALKLRRSLSKANPTPVPAPKAYANLIEEVADVLNCLGAIGIDIDRCEVQDIKAQKIDRWVSRLRKTMQEEGT